MSTLLVSKKTIDRMGKTINESQGSTISAFARRQMEKMGWQEGKGLGKNEDGMASHIKQKKKENVAGLGAEKTTEFMVDTSLKGGAKTSITGGNDNWWHDAFSSKLKSLNKSKKSKKRKSSHADPDASSEDEKGPPTMEELFAATGGARLGMRARGDQAGKFSRSEKDVRVRGQAANEVKLDGSDGSGDLDGRDGVNECKDDEEAEALRRREKKQRKKLKRAARQQREEEE